MAKKLIALLAVLALVVTPLFVIEEDAQAESNSSPIYLDQISDDSHWVKGTTDTTTNTMTLTITGKAVKDGTDDTLVLMNSSGGGTLPSVIKFAEGSIIPAGATVATLGWNGEGSVPTRNLTVDKDITVKGILSASIILGAATITVDGGVLDVGKGSHSTIGEYKNKMTSVAGSCIDVINKGVVYQLNLDYTYTGSTSGHDYYSVEVDGMFGDDFTITNDSTTANGTKYTLSGTAFGLSAKTGYSQIGFGNEAATYEFEDAYLSNTILCMNDGKEFLIDDDRQIINYAADDVVFAVINASPTLMQSIKSPNGLKHVIMPFTLNDIYDNEEVENTTLLYATIDQTGMVPYFNVNCLATEGIKTIGEDNVINFVEAGAVFDLTKIKVTCESGYHFVGWYVMDENGVMCKIVNPSQFVALDNMTIYAMADHDIPNHDYTGFFIGLIVLLVLIVLAACVGIYLKATDKPAKKTTKR